MKREGRMEADYIILCDGILSSKNKNALDGGVAVKGRKIICVGTKNEVAPYLGVNTEVVEFKNMILFTFRIAEDEKDEDAWANIAVFAGGNKRNMAQIKKMVNLRMLMYEGEMVFYKPA